MATREDVRQAIRDVREFHALGLQALEPDGSRRRLSEADAAKAGTPLSTWRTARQVAEDFDRTALQALCKVLESQVGRDGVVLGKSAVVVMLRASSPGDSARASLAKRLAFLRTAISSRWSVQKMELEVTKRFGTRRSGGRRPALPADEAGVCQFLEKLCEQWRRLYRELNREREPADRVSLPDLAPGVRRALAKAIQVLEHLQRAAIKRLGELQSGRVERKPLSDDH